MLEISTINKNYQGPDHTVQALKNVDFSLKPGDFASIMGPSGCGKSTLLLVAGGMLHPDNGKVKLSNTDIYSLNDNKRADFRAANIGFIFQQFHLIPYLSVLENVMAPTMAQPIDNAENKAKEILEKLQLQDRLHHKPSALSIGEQQRVAMARALMPSPSLLLADEPTGNLDNKNAEIVMNFLSDYCESGGIVIMVTHDERAASHGRISLTMSQGELSKN